MSNGAVRMIRTRTSAVTLDLRSSAQWGNCILKASLHSGSDRSHTAWSARSPDGRSHTICRYGSLQLASARGGPAARLSTGKKTTVPLVSTLWPLSATAALPVLVPAAAQFDS